jgi:ketol-acid reductoisomerase
MRVSYDRDADPALIRAKSVAVIGYGAQGHAHALNLRDSGVSDLSVALKDGSASAEKARAEGLRVVAVAEAAERCDVLMVCAPDEVQPDLYAREIAPHMRRGKTLLFAHGFAMHFKLIDPPQSIDIAMVAPKGPGTALRDAYKRGGGLPCIVALQNDASGEAFPLALSYGAAIGCGRAGMIHSTFQLETEGDLFGEQAVLCGGLAALIRTAWEVQVEAGWPPELAYFDCLHEVKLLSDLIHQRGIAGMNLAISNTAEYGEYVTGARIISPAVKEAMRAALAEIQSGAFARDWMAEHASGQKRLKALRAEAAAHPIEAAGETVRALVAGAAKGRTE